MLEDFLLGIELSEKSKIALFALSYFFLCGFLSLGVMIRVKNWPKVTGRLDSHSIVGWRFGENLKNKVEYSYKINDIFYQNQKLSLWHVRSSYNLQFVLNWQIRHIERQLGDKVTVYYNPLNHQVSYLIVPGWKQILFVITICFVCPILVFLITFL